MFSKLFQVLPNFHECLYNSIETRSTCFLFPLENTATRKRKTTLIIKMKILFAGAIATSTARASFAPPSRYTNTIFNQSACVLSQDCFLKCFKVHRIFGISFIVHFTSLEKKINNKEMNGPKPTYVFICSFYYLVNSM